MEALFAQTLIAANAGLSYLALLGALCIPDTCASLEAPDGKTTGARYQAWFDKHLGHIYHLPGLSGESCYQFRCALLHQGTTQAPNPAKGFTRVIFLVPGTSTVLMHRNMMNDAYNLDLVAFCNDVVNAARAWQQTAVGTQPYERNAEKSISLHPNGLAPYIVGVPVIG
jgi:hypothetical protein